MPDIDTNTMTPETQSTHTDIAERPPLAGLSQTDISWDTITQTRKIVPTMDWVPNADKSEISRAFAVYLKRVNSARSSSEQSLAIKYLFALPTAILRKSGRKEPSRRNRRSLSNAIRERCRKALNWELPGLLAEAREAFRDCKHKRTLPSPNDQAKSQQRRAIARAQKGEYRRALAALMSAPIADTADTEVQNELARLHPAPSQPVSSITHIDSLPPAPAYPCLT